MKKSDEFLKNVKKGSIGKLIVGIILLLIAVSTFVSFYFVEQDKKKNPTDLYDVNGTGIYAKLDVQYLLDYFAVPEDNSKEKAFIAYDENNIMYIVVLNENDIKKLQEIWDYTYAEEEPEKVPDAVTIYGKTEIISSDLKKLAIKYYNEVFDEEFLTNSNFESYFGKYYLESTMDFIDSNLFYGVISSGIFGIIGLVFILIYVFHKHKTKKILEKYNSRMHELMNLIDSPSCYHNKKTKIYFTDTCIISYIHGLEIIEYKDIVWIYPHEYRYRGAITKSIYVITKDSKVHILSQLNISKKTSIMFDEEYQSLINKTPEVLLGYTKENAKKAKELYIKK